MAYYSTLVRNRLVGCADAPCSLSLSLLSLSLYIYIYVYTMYVYRIELVVRGFSVAHALLTASVTVTAVLAHCLLRPRLGLIAAITDILMMAMLIY